MHYLQARWIINIDESNYPQPRQHFMTLVYAMLVCSEEEFDEGEFIGGEGGFRSDLAAKSSTSDSTIE